MIKKKTIEFCMNKSKIRKDNITKLESELHDEISKENSNAKKVEELEKQINNLYTEKAKGAQVRSRINWVENSEKNNAYFLGLEKTRQSQKVIKKLKLSNGNITESSETICKEIKEFYSDLYSSQNIDKHCISQYLDAVNVERKVSDKDRDTCEGNVLMNVGKQFLV